MSSPNARWYLPGVLAILGCASVATAQARFYGIGFLPGITSSAASGLSRDGSIVTGFSRALNDRAVRWSEAHGLEALALSSPNAASSYGAAVSADGSIIVGSEGLRACRWVNASAPEFVTNTYSFANAVSADGSWIVGMSGELAARWSEPTGLLFLGDVRGPSYSNWATGVSDDGSVVVGRAYLSGRNSAFRWSPSTGFIAFGNPSSNGVTPLASAVSADGSVVCGVTYEGSNALAFRWTQAQGLEMLGDLPGGIVSSQATAMTLEGDIIVGSGNISCCSTGQRAMIWTRARGMENLHTLLTNVYGVDLAGWELRTANGVSADGLTICGTGIHNGVEEGCVVNLPTTCQLSIPRQPINRVMHSNDTITLSVFAAGLPPLTYQWRRHGQALSDGPGISGSTTTSLTLSNLATSDDYDVVAANPCGSVTSRTVRVTVVPPSTMIVARVKHDATGANDGQSWADAFTSLQAAIDQSVPNTQLWVARGTYGNRVTIALRSGLSIYGGFAGTETTLDARDPAANLTWIDGQDGVRCVEAVNCVNTRLDGFTITRGYAANDVRGAGVYISGGYPTLSNCVITANRLPSTGSTMPRGGGLFIHGNAVVRMTDCVVAQNESGAVPPSYTFGEAGGLAVESSSLEMIRCTIADNRAASGVHSDCGGGMPFGGNAGGDAGGVRLENATLTLFRSIVRGNSAPSGGSGSGCSTGSANGGFRAGNGGGIYAVRSTITADSSLFMNNSAGDGGNAGTSRFGWPTDSIGTGGSGGAIYAISGGSLTIRNCTFVGNSAGRGGRGTYGGSDADPGAGGAIHAVGIARTISNCILWNNTGPNSILSNQIADEDDSGVRWSCIQGLSPAPNSGNIASDPAFVGATDFSLRRGSRCIDAGNNAFDFALLDLAGRPRRADVLGVLDDGVGTAPIVDMGAYEASYCLADVDDGTFQGVPDGGVTVDDLLYYLFEFAEGSPVADVDDGTSSGHPDGGVTIDDLLHFLLRYERGC